MSLVVLAVDGQSMTLLPRVLCASAIAFLSAAAFAPFLTARTSTKVAIMLLIAFVLGLVPFLLPFQAHAARFLVGVICGLLMLKNFDLYSGSERGALPDIATSLLFLAGPFLVFRRIPTAPPRTARAESARFVRLAFEAVAGFIVLAVVMQLDWRTRPFIFEHAVKAAALCLMVFAVVNAQMSLTRLLGGVAHDFTDRPFTARTPAEFWRRYNRWVGQFFYEDVFKPAGGRRTPVRVTLLVFLFSALLHEYLFFVITGRVFGYQLVFFGLQGVAAAATLRWRPKRWAAAMAIALTLAFNLTTSAFFFANVAGVEPIYARPLPNWLTLPALTPFS